MYDDKSAIRQRVFLGGSEMGLLMQSIDWSKTPLGPVEEWPQSLQTAVSICLFSRFPIFLWWGRELVQIYNDAYRPILGTTKHPAAMGQRGEETWSEIWHIIGPMLRSVYEQGKGTWSDDQMLPIDRHGFTEEVYFTFSYSPIFDESGGVGGIFTAVTETTKRVLSERRLRTLRDLSENSTKERSVETAVQIAAEVLGRNATDIPFALIYLLNNTDEPPILLARSGVYDLTNHPFPFEKIRESGQSVLIDDLTPYFPILPQGPWEEPPHRALLLPLLASNQLQIAGYIVVGVSSRLVLDDDYRDFFNLVAAQISTRVANARAYEEERRRAEALAELDRAKTVFFNNVSHEFRTPLTLMLGPLEDVLNGEQGVLTSDQHETLTLVYRNSLRLLKLVNTLLDFSRIEANRIEARYEPTDLAGFTIELTSVFRSAIEKAGLRLIVDCPPLPEPLYIDRDMYEKIVLNLLSNALKFTFEGEIEVALRSEPKQVKLIVRDTGVGIPPEELSQIFQRFHRVKDTRSRSFEGSGIGLSLVQDLAQLHGGSIEVESAVGKGTTFVVTLPCGYKHLPQKSIVETSTPLPAPTGAFAYVEEAQRWLPDYSGEVPELDYQQDSPSPRIRENTREDFQVVVVDDNADMRQYLTRLLSPLYTVQTYTEGKSALASIQRQLPDLVVSDIMMPGIDGIELVRILRDDPETSSLPIILLSARAGEEAIVDGLEAGADDYLIKPFSAREFLARVDAQLQLSEMRRNLMEKTVDVAVLEERQRLSRELHDAVNQTLFTANLVAQSLPHFWDNAPEKVLPNLYRLSQLTQGAMAEMRSLLLELRPSSWENMKMNELVKQMSASLTGRSALKIDLHIEGEEVVSIPVDVRIALYRITQEAFNNILKHAKATKADVYLSYKSDRLELTVCDNGQGFDFVRTTSGIGMNSMRERAEAIGATLQIKGTPGEGTQVTVIWAYPTESV
jgi:signal transduction histidine kinase